MGYNKYKISKYVKGNDFEKIVTFFGYFSPDKQGIHSPLVRHGRRATSTRSTSRKMELENQERCQKSLKTIDEKILRYARLC